MKRYSTILIFMLIVQYSFSQTTDDKIVGTWKGTSLCQVKNSPCHDEVAIYHAVKAAAPGTYTFQMNKIVNGVEEEMGVTDFILDKSGQVLIGKTENRQKKVGIWEFRIKDGHISGTLTVEGNLLYRKIEVTKQ